jgi:hypothetical protein
MDRMQFVKAAHDYYAVAIVYYFLDKDRSQATPTRVVDTLTEEWGLVKRIYGRRPVPAVCQVHDTRRFLGHGRFGSHRIFA